MNTSLPGHHSPGAGFEVPLEMLAACHGRVQQQCQTLQRLHAHLQQHGADAQARQAAQAVLRYFDTAAGHHHEDEEQDLFPALLESVAGSDAVCLRDLTVSLSAEHRTLEQHWGRLRRCLKQVADGRADGWSGDLAHGFIALYQQHIKREETELLPMAARLLGTTELDRIGAAMRRRRGVALPAG